MDSVTEFTGIAGFALFLGVPTTLALSVLLTWKYRRSVIREMNRRAGGNWHADRGQPSTRSGFGFAATIEQERHTKTDWAVLRVKAACAVVLSGIAYASLATILLFAVGGTEVFPLRVLLSTTIRFTPFMLVLGLFFMPSRRAAGITGIAYAGCIGAFGLLGSLRWYEPLVAWAMWGGIPAVLVGGFLWHRLRAVGPLSLAFVLLVIVGANLAVGWLGEHVRGASELAAMFGLGAVGVMVAVILAGGAPAVLIAWVFLKWLGKLHAARRINDRTIISAAVLFTFTLFLGTDMVFAGKSASYFPLAFLPLASSALVAYGVRRRLRAAGPASRPLELLFLRVFAQQSHGPVLWRALADSWRYVGTIHLIGGPDLATSTIEPHRFLDFLSGRLARRFIADRTTLEEAISGFDTEPDVEDRFAINELYCRGDTWQMAFERMSAQCDVILMDLRDFTRERAGAQFELKEVAASGALARSVLVVNRHTDQRLLSETIAAAGIPPSAASNLLVVDGRLSSGELMKALLAAARPMNRSMPVEHRAGYRESDPHASLR